MRGAEIKVQLLGFYAHLGAEGVDVAIRAYDWVFERGGQAQGVSQGQTSEPTSAVVPPPCDITGQADGALQINNSEARRGLLIRLRAENVGNAEIAKMLGVSPSRVSQLVKLYGLPARANVSEKRKDASRQAGAKRADLAGRAAATERKGDQAICRSDAPPNASAHPTTASGGVRGASNKQIRPASAGAGTAQAGVAADDFLDVSSLDSPPAGTSPAGGVFSKPAPADSDEDKVQEFLRRKGATTEAHYGEHHDVFALMKSWGFGYVPASAKRFVTDPISGAQLRIEDYFALCRKECQRRNHALPATLAEKGRRAAT